LQWLSTESGHCIKFEDNTVVAGTTGYTHHIVKEAAEIQLHPDNFNRDTDLLQVNSVPAYQNNLKKQSHKQTKIIIHRREG
jgi:hypothetical protein